MYQTNLNQRSLRSALLLGAASAAAASIAMPAYAQDQSVETVVVTGSRIPQTGLYAPSPVTAVGQQEMKLEGTSDVSTLLNTLPAVYVDESEQASNGASQTATVDLRDIGSKRTLVLVDGSRLMPGDPTVPVADINQIPAAMVDHVELLTGGASAVYGSDAIAGVVNFIMRKDFEGIEVDGQYSVYQDNNNSHYADSLFESAAFPKAGGLLPGVEAPTTGNVLDGQGNNWSLVMGTNSPNGKGNITAYVAYRSQEEILQGARDYSECQIVANGANARRCAGSITYNFDGSLDELAAGGATNYYFQTGTGHPGTGHFGPLTGASNQYFNFASYQQLIRPDTRYNAGFFAHYDVNPMLEAYSSMMFTDDESHAQLGPSGVFDGTGPVSGAFAVNCTNPFLTAQEVSLVCGGITPTATHYDAHGNPNGTLFSFYGASGPYGNGYDTGNNGAANIKPGFASLLIGRRNVEGGARSYSDDHESYRIKVGFKGDLGDGFAYDVYAQLGITNFSEADGGQLLTANVVNALDTTDGVTCSSGAAGCSPLDIFNGVGSITPAMEKYLSAPGLIQGQTKEEVMSGSITGDFGRWGGQSPWAKNPIQFSLGAEYREESLTLTPDEEEQQGNLEGGSVISPEKGSYNVTEGFTEVKVPLVQDMPWVEDLTLNGGYRYSSYNTAGMTQAYKYGAEWQPVDDIRFRASAERAVRAPNILELFTPQSLALFSGQDPCGPKGLSGLTSGDQTIVEHNCSTAPGRANVPNPGAITLNCPASQCVEFGGGNPSLKPEVSDTRTAGFVFTPRFMDGFTATVDWFSITLSQAVGIIPESTTLAECYGVGATAASQASFCPLIVRTLATHSIAINSGSPATSGYIVATNLNTGGLKTQGVDVEMNYQSDLASWGMPNSGSLSFNVIGTWLNDLTITPISGLGSYDCAGLYGPTCSNPTSRWRHKFRVTWSSPWDFDLSLQWRYFGNTSLDANRTNPLLAGTTSNIDGNIPAYSWFDLAGDWTIREGVDFRAGINNIFDRHPPIISDGYTPLPATGNTFPGIYDTLGRYMFVGVTLKY